MQPLAVQLIIDEHQALATVIRALQEAVAPARKVAVRPCFDELRELLLYLDEMPAQVHHMNESELLFPCIRLRCPALRPVLDRLEAEHGRGESSVRDLEQALTAWQTQGEAHREPFERLLSAFSAGYLGHMEVEENYVLPVAMDYLSAADWGELEAAFSRQRGALAESMTRRHRALRERLAEQLCSPGSP